MSEQAAIEVRGFKGLNLREPPAMVQDDELVECVNFDIGRAGELEKRSGFSILHTGSTLGLFPVRLIGHFNTSTFSYIIAQAGPNIYRSTNGADWTLIGAFVVEAGTQYVDKFYMVRKTGTVLVYDGVSAPTAIAASPTGTYCKVYKNRLFVLNSDAAGTDNSKLTFSDIIVSTTNPVFPTNNTILVAPGDGDFLTAISIIHDILLVFKGRTTWALYVQGAPENWILRNSNPEIGCISKYTPREIEGFMFFVGARGVYKTDGNLFEDVSSSIQTLFEGRIVNITTANIDTAAWWDDKYIVLFHPTPSISRYFVYHLRTGGWTEWVPVIGITPGTFLEINTSTPSKGLYCGDTQATGKTFRYGDGGFTDGGTEYVCSMKTKDFDLGMPSAMKKGKWLAADSNGICNMVWTHIVDQVDRVALVTVGNLLRNSTKFRGPGYFRTWTLKMTMQSNTAFNFNGVTLYLHRKTPVAKART